MFIVFLFFFFDLKRQGNKYVEEKKVSQEAKKEAEMAVFLTELKTRLDKPFITTQKAILKKDGKDLSGWKVVLPDVEMGKVDSIKSFMTKNGFKLENDFYTKEGTVCSVTIVKETNVTMICAYTE